MNAPVKEASRQRNLARFLADSTAANRSRPAVMSAAAALAVTSTTLAQPCQPDWSPVGTGVATQAILALASFEGELYVAGYFPSAGGVPANNIANWDGQSWSALGTGTEQVISCLAVFDDALYAGGDFVTAGGLTVNYVAKWDGASWSALDGGVTGSGRFTQVQAMAVFDDGGGPALYAGGYFTSAGSVAASHIAKWNGQAWSALGAGVDDPIVRSLVVFDDGGGPALYVGGDFPGAGGVPAQNVAKWDGQTWSPLGSGTSGTSSRIRALTAFDDGGGPALYAGGDFGTAGGVEARRIAKWDGEAWSALGTGIHNLGEYVKALTVFDDGGGPALYAAGQFATAGGTPASHIAKWDGQSWSALGSGTDNIIYSLATFNDGGGPALYAGGGFTAAGGQPASNIARWGCPPGSPCYANCDGSTTAPALNVADFTCFLQSFAAGESTANCDQSTAAPVLNVADFTCFLQQFAAGCP